MSSRKTPRTPKRAAGLCRDGDRGPQLAVGCEPAVCLRVAQELGRGVQPECVVPSRRREPVTLLHPPLPLAGVSIGMERGCQQNESRQESPSTLVLRTRAAPQAKASSVCGRTEWLLKCQDRGSVGAVPLPPRATPGQTPIAAKLSPIAAKLSPIAAELSQSQQS